MTVAPVLVTGSDGRLGSALFRTGSDRLDLIGLKSPRSTAGGPTLDVTDAVAVQRMIGDIRPRVIIHLAAMVGPACDRDPAAAEAVNVIGTGHVLAAARDHGVERLVFVSTAAVYGDFRRRPVSEEDPPAPAGEYASSKLRAERVLEESSGPVAVDVLRVFNIYGPEMPDSLIMRLQSATADAPVHLAGLDGFVRDYVHTDDVVQAVFAAANSGGVGFRVLNVGTGIPWSNRELMESLPESLRTAVVVGPEVDSYSCADITAITRAHAWRPTVVRPFG